MGQQKSITKNKLTEPKLKSRPKRRAQIISIARWRELRRLGHPVHACRFIMEAERGGAR